MQNNKVSKTQIIMLMTAMFLIMLSPVGVLATGGAVTGLTNLANFFSSVVRLGGVMLVIYGISVFGPGFSQHDATGIKSGIFIIAGGIVMVFHMEILTLMGITI